MREPNADAAWDANKERPEAGAAPDATEAEGFVLLPPMALRRQQYC
jgi:hypothetical protein